MQAKGLANDGAATELIHPIMNDDRLAVLEEKLAWLQRHVAEQDKAMLEMAAEIDRLKKRATEMAEKLSAEPGQPPAGEERPPHY